MPKDKAHDDVLSFDVAATLTAVLREKLSDAMTPGYQAEFDPDEAVAAGAFSEDALSEADAVAASLDGAWVGTP